MFALDVAMCDSRGVSRIQPIGDFAGQRQQRVEFQRAPCDTVLQSRSIQERVIQGGRGSGLAPEPTQGLGVASDVVRQELERDKAPEPAVRGFVDHPHSAAAQLLDDAVVSDGPADQGSGAFTLVRAWLAGDNPRGHVDRWMLQEPRGPVLRRQQGPGLASAYRTGSLNGKERRHALLRVFSDVVELGLADDYPCE
jgi:hypothetical protein